MDHKRVKREADALMKDDKNLSKEQAMEQVANSIISELEFQKTRIMGKSRIGMSHEDILARTPELAESAKKMREADIITDEMRQEHQRLVDLYKPSENYESVPEPATEEQAKFALENGKGQNKEKADKYGLPMLNLIKGAWAQLRLDIPSYSQNETWVVSVHEPKSLTGSDASHQGGTVIGYQSVASLTDVTFGMPGVSALKIASGIAKGTIATMMGKWKPITPEEAKSRADEVLNDKDWIQVGMDPERHAYFYDRNTQEPIVSADEVIQIGSLVLAKNAIAGKRSNFKFSIAAPTDLWSSAAEVYQKATPTSAKDRLDIAKSKGNEVLVKLGLSAMTQNQLVEIGAPILPILKLFQKARNKYDVEESKWHTGAGSISERWEKLAPNYKTGDRFLNEKWKHRNKLEQQRLSELMHIMTTTGYDPRNTRPEETEHNGIMLRDWDAVKDKYDKLLPTTKELLNEVEKFHLDVVGELKQSLEDKIQMSEMPEDNKLSLIAKIKDKFNTVSGPYFPLMRFGNFWVAYKGGFQMFESKVEQDKFIKKLKLDGTSVQGSGKNFEDFAKLEGVDIGFIDDVNALIDGLDIKESEELKGQIFQLYLDALPETSMRKKFIHRKNTPGWEQDALRSFAKKAFHDGKQLAKLKFAPEMRKVLNDAKEIVKIGNSKPLTLQLEQALRLLPEVMDYLNNDVPYDEVAGRFEGKADHEENNSRSDNVAVEKILKRFANFKDEYDRDKALDDYFNDSQHLLSGVKAYHIGGSDVIATDVINALDNSYENMMTSTISGATNLINQGVFTFMLGFNPGSAIVNYFQTPGVSLPVAAGRHGFTKASKELTAAYKAFYGNKTNGEYGIEGGLVNAGEKAMFEALKSNGTFDRTRSYDLAGLSEEGIERGTLHRDVMMASTFMFHKAEVANREITALMAYRLEFAKTGDINKSIEYANNLVRDTHLDYSSANRPDLFQGNFARIATQFKMYSQGMTYLWGKTAYDALISGKVTPERKAESRNILLSLVGVQVSFAGVLGLPIGGILMGAQMLVSFMDDDDDPIDIEVEIRKALNAVVGNDLGRILSHGVLSESGADFAGRLSLSDLWIREPDRELEGKDKAYYLLKTILGPSAGILEKFAIGMKLMGDGDYRRGAETMLPNALSSVAKAYRAIDEGGSTNSKGDMIYKTNAWEQSLQAIGLRPSGLANQMEQNSAIKNRTDAVAGAKGDLLHKAVRAKIAKNDAAYQEAWSDIKAFNTKYPDRKIKPSDIAKSLKTHNTNAKNAKNGLTIKKKDKLLAEEERLL